jgi:hypothetical protein
MYINYLRSSIIKNFLHPADCPAGKADLFSVMRSVGYEDIVSIEHEDFYMSIDEGLEKAVHNLKQVMMLEPGSKPKAFNLDERFK